MDRLRDAQAIDRMYHRAKLNAAAFGEPERIWREHEQVRAAILARPSDAPREMTRDEWLSRVAAIDQKMRNAGLRPPRSGELH
jgi:DNA-binding GntR family transcriptional regulator